MNSTYYPCGIAIAASFNRKVALAPGQSKRISVVLPASAFKYYDIYSHDWVADKADYKIQVGASALDIKIEAKVE